MRNSNALSNHQRAKSGAATHKSSDLSSPPVVRTSNSAHLTTPQQPPSRRQGTASWSVVYPWETTPSLTANYLLKLNASWRTIKKSQTTSVRTLQQDCLLCYGIAVNHYCNTKCRTFRPVCSIVTSKSSMTASASWSQKLRSTSWTWKKKTSRSAVCVYPSVSRVQGSDR